MKLFLGATGREDLENHDVFFQSARMLCGAGAAWTRNRHMYFYKKTQIASGVRFVHLNSRAPPGLHVFRRIFAPRRFPSLHAAPATQYQLHLKIRPRKQHRRDCPCHTGPKATSAHDSNRQPKPLFSVREKKQKPRKSRPPWTTPRAAKLKEAMDSERKSSIKFLLEMDLSDAKEIPKTCSITLRVSLRSPSRSTLCSRRRPSSRRSRRQISRGRRSKFPAVSDGLKFDSLVAELSCEIKLTSESSIQQPTQQASACAPPELAYIKARKDYRADGADLPRNRHGRAKKLWARMRFP